MSVKFSIHSSDSPSDNSTRLYAVDSSVNGPKLDSGVSSLSIPPSVPLAALDLLRSRLSNANEVTPITYMSPDLIAEGLLAEQINNLLVSNLIVRSTFSELPSEILGFLCRTNKESSHHFSIHSPVPKVCILI